MPISLEQIVFVLLCMIIGFGIFMGYIYPKLFGKPMGGKISQPRIRKKPVLIDGDIPGGMAEIEARNDYENGTTTLNLRNENGSFVKEYVIAEIVPVNISQVLVDNAAPLFITKDTKYSKSEYEKDIAESREKERDAIADRDHWKKELNSLKANVSSEVNKQVEQAMKASQQNRPDWSKAGH